MSHTWPLSYTYVRCPACGWIQLDRSLPVQQLGVWEKEVSCTRCHKLYTLASKPYHPSDTLTMWEGTDEHPEKRSF